MLQLFPFVFWGTTTVVTREASPLLCAFHNHVSLELCKRKENTANQFSSRGIIHKPQYNNKHPSTNSKHRSNPTSTTATARQVSTLQRKSREPSIKGDGRDREAAKLSNKKYYTYSTEQINELFGAIQTALDETKATFTTTNAEKKKLFTFSA